MSTDLDFELMKKLSHTPGVSGFEDKVALILRDELAKYVDSVRIDKMGNVIGSNNPVGVPVEELQALKRSTTKDKWVSEYLGEFQKVGLGALTL